MIQVQGQSRRGRGTVARGHSIIDSRFENRLSQIRVLMVEVRTLLTKLGITSAYKFGKVSAVFNQLSKTTATS